jgi:GT2 family glycosyltransferase
LTPVDVVVVSYNSGDHLRGCVEPLARVEGVHVIVVDNASLEDSLHTVADLSIETIALAHNGGFAHGCNVGWRAGSRDYVLFLNPDARIDERSLEILSRELDRRPALGAVAPLVRRDDGSIDFSQRRYPRLRSTYAQALFLQRVFPRAGWTDELVRDAEAYREPGSPDWVSGAAVMVKRSVLEELGGWDEGFFMYCEDTDLCRRLDDAGHELGFEPSASVMHVGGASAPRASLLPVLASSRLRYATKHRGRAAASLERGGIALGALTHAVVGRGGSPVRAGHLKAVRIAMTHTVRV